MALIKKIKNGNTDIEIYDSSISKEEQKENLINLYKTINNIANNQIEQGKNVNDWFYTKKELEAMKESNNYRFL